MKYTEQAVETLDDAGSVIANKNIEIEQLRQRVAELEKERLEQQEKLCGCIVNLGQLRAERDEWEANSEEWEQEYYKVCRERDKATQYWQIAEGRCDALKQQRDELVANAEESDAVRDRLAKLLSETAIALKGEEEALQRHSWHDLPVVALAAMLEITILKQQREELLAALERSLESFEYIAKYGNSCGHSQLRIPDLKAAIASVKEK